MRVYATKAAVSVNGFKLTSLGNLDLDDNVDEVEVLADGKVLENVKFSVKNDELNISFDSQEIENHCTRSSYRQRKTCKSASSSWRGGSSYWRWDK